MNKYFLAVAFIVLILSGFTFNSLFYSTGLYLQSLAVIFFYYGSLAYVMVQFIKKPKGVD